MKERFYNKMSKQILILGLLLIFSLLYCRSWADDTYVTDSFKITLRTGPSTENKIIAMLPSGMHVRVLESQGDWKRVETIEDGESKTGWLLDRYLMTREPFEQRAKKLLEENNRLREKLLPLQKDINEKNTQVQGLRQQLEKTSKSLQSIEQQYKSLKSEAADYLALKDAHNAVQSELLRTQEDFESLKTNYNNLKSSKRNRWFMTGAGVLLCGLFIGLLLGRREKKRKSSYY